MDKEERELQIKLAQIQADINIFMSISLGQYAAMGVFLVAGYTFIMDGLMDGFPCNLIRLAIASGMIVSAILAGIRAFQNLDKVK
jgi:hypothetical protein